MKKIILVIIFLFSFNLFAKEIPRMTGPVIDEAGILSQNAHNAISNALKSYFHQTKIQIQLYITSSLDGENIEEFSIKVVDAWKLGGKEDDKGTLFLIALQDRKMRIEVGQGLEGDLTDAMAGRIIESVVPYFKNGDYENGIIFGLNAIVLQTKGDLALYPTKDKVYKKNSNKRKSSLGFFIFIFFLFMMLGRRSRVGWFLLGSAMGGGRSSGGFGSGGGGWSGGGGGFSGGGASGSW